MKNILFSFLMIIILTACAGKQEQRNPPQTPKKNSVNDWAEVLTSTSWCTVLDGDKVVADRAAIYDFNSDNRVTTVVFTKRGKETPSEADLGVWEVQGDKLLVTSEEQTVEFDMAVVPVESLLSLPAKTFVRPGLKSSAACLMMKSDQWGAVHCPCQSATFESGFDI